MSGQCPCNNPKCPQSSAFAGCVHCLCLPCPDPACGVSVDGAPMGSTCCKCDHFQTSSWIFDSLAVSGTTFEG